MKKFSLKLITLISLFALFSCKKEAHQVCKCHREIWKIQTNHTWQMVYKDSTNTYLDFCANHGAIEHQMNGNQEVTVCK